MAMADFLCPICGGPTINEEQKKTMFSGRQIIYRCQNKDCRTTLTQFYDDNKKEYYDGIYLADSGSKSRVWTLYASRSLTAEEWKIVREGGRVPEKENPGFTKPSAEASEPTPSLQASPGFRTLLGYGQFVAACGWLLLGLAAIALVIGLMGTLVGAFTGVVSAIVIAVLGIGFVVSGQVITCFVAIEKNTREATKLLEQLKK